MGRVLNHFYYLLSVYLLSAADVNIYTSRMETSSLLYSKECMRSNPFSHVDVIKMIKMIMMIMMI